MKQKNSILYEDEDFNLSALFRQTAHAMLRAREKELKPYGITAAQASVLFYIEAISQTEKNVTQAELSRWFFREVPSVFGLLARMEKEGLIQRIKDLGRRNWIRVATTRKGRRALEQSKEREAFHKFISVLSEKERRQLWPILVKLRASAFKECGVTAEPPFPTTIPLLNKEIN